MNTVIQSVMNATVVEQAIDPNMTMLSGTDINGDGVIVTYDDDGLLSYMGLDENGIDYLPYSEANIDLDCQSVRVLDDTDNNYVLECILL